MLDERKTAILRAVVETYIETAQPVGSGHITETADLGVSSATVRSELGQLDQLGFLTQPHKSAGRIPTDKAYRVFVDSLGEPGLQATEFAKVRDFFDQTHGEIEEMLDHTSRLLAELTGIASVVVAPDREAATVRSVQLVDLAPRVVLAVMVLSDGTVQKRTIELAEELDDNAVAVAVAQGHLSAAMVGRAISEAGTPAPSGNATADRLVETARENLTVPADAGEIYVGGRAAVAGAFPAAETVREVLSVLEKQLVVVTLLRDVLDRGMSVAIGGETGVDPLADCSLVVAPYAVGGNDVGTIGLLGPTRMNYPHALATVAVVSQSLGRHLTEG